MATEEVIEKARLFNFGDLTKVERNEAYFAEIAHKLIPDHDWEAKPLEFCFADDDSVNAFIIPAETPPVVVITRGALNFVKTEDELGFLIGHELGHDDTREYLGDARSTKGDEIGADIFATECLIRAGYKPDAGIDFFRRLNGIREENKMGPAYEAFFDRHPLDGNRIALIGLMLGNETLLKSGKIHFEKESPLPSFLFEPTSARNRPYIDGWKADGFDSLSQTEKLRLLQRGIMDNLDEEKGVLEVFRCAQFLEVLKKTKSDRSSEFLAAAEDFIDTILLLDPYNLKGWFDPIYDVVAYSFVPGEYRKPDFVQIWQGGYAKSGPYLPVLGPFRKLHEALQNFASLSSNKSVETIESAAQKVSDELDALEPYLNNDQSTYISDDGRRKVKKGKFNSNVIRETEITGFAEPGRLYSSLFPLAKGDVAKKVIWRLGGGARREYWKIIGPEKVGELLSLRPDYMLSGLDGWGPLEENRTEAYLDLKRDAEVWLEKKLRPALKGKPKTISEYAERYKDELFSLKESRNSSTDPVRLAIHGVHPSIKEFAPFVLKKFRKAPDEEHENLVNELENFYKRAVQWHAKAEKVVMEADLDERHPYVQLLLSEELPVSGLFRYKYIAAIADRHSLEKDSFVRLCGMTSQKSVRDCIPMYQPYIRACYSLLILDILRDNFHEIFRNKKSMGWNDKDFLEFAKIFIDEDRDQSLRINSQDFTIYQFNNYLFHDKLKMQSPEATAASLAGHSLEEITILYRYADKNRLFPSPNERAALGNILLERIKQAAPQERIKACEEILFSKEVAGSGYVTSNLALRDEALDLWQQELIALYGADDGSALYFETVGKKIDQIIEFSKARDRELILAKLADGLIIQKDLSGKIRAALKITRQTLDSGHWPIVGAELLFIHLEKNENLRLSMIDFLSEPLSHKSLSAISTFISKDEDEVALVALSGSQKFGEKLYPRQERNLLTSLQDIHTHFCSLSVEQRSAFLSLLLVPGEHRLDEQRYEESYKKALGLVMNKVFPETGESAEDTRSFLAAYVDTAAEYERIALLAGMLSVSVDGDPGQRPSTAQQAAKVMETMGPAYVKLGQAINSHPQCPADWKAATNNLKSAAKTDPRWELIRQIEGRLPECVKKDIVSYGPVIGSASFNTAMQMIFEQDGRKFEVVALLERPHAAARAEGGFEHLEKAITAWHSLIANEHKDTMLEMLGEGQEMAKNETSREVGDRQFDFSQDNYASRQVVVSEGGRKTVVNINPVDSLFSSDGVRLLSLAKGTHFLDLPETTIEEKELKKTIAKAYVALELSTLLSGRAFDCDRHGRQLKVDVHPDGTIDLNLYDFGGMAIAPPSDKQKAALGKAINAVALGVVKGGKPESIITGIIAKTTDMEERPYLMRTRKAWLALSDFMVQLDDQGDYIDVLQAAMSSVDPTIQSNMPVLKMLKAASLFGLKKAKSQIVLGKQAEMFAKNRHQFRGDLIEPILPEAPLRQPVIANVGKSHLWTSDRMNVSVARL